MNLENKVVSSPIATLIPHREPMVMVDRVVSLDGLQTKTAYHITPKNLFISNGELSEMGMIENVAQSSFIFLHYFFEEQDEDMWKKEHETLGFISAITSAEVFFTPRVDQILETTTRTELVFSSDSLKICNIEGSVSVDGKIALQTSMKMLLQTREK